MARIKGVDIPNEKHIEVSLTYIHGIGRSLSRTILKNVKIDPTRKAGDLSIEELNLIRDEINHHMIEGDLRRDTNMNIKTKMEINSYQGNRHRKGLPVRGQSTKSNARTRKGKKGRTIANKKK